MEVIDTYLARVNLLKIPALEIDNVIDSSFEEDVVKTANRLRDMLSIPITETGSYSYKDYFSMFSSADESSKYLTHRERCKAKEDSLRDKKSKPLIRRRTRLW